MKEVLTISLDKVRFWGFHGVFPEEKVLGNWFTVSLKVSVISAQTVNKLDQTIDYGSLYQLVKIEMQQPTALLEQLAERIKHKVVHQFGNISKLELEIQKQRPAIGLLDGNSSIRLTVDL